MQFARSFIEGKLKRFIVHSVEKFGQPRRLFIIIGICRFFVAAVQTIWLFAVKFIHCIAKQTHNVKYIDATKEQQPHKKKKKKRGHKPWKANIKKKIKAKRQKCQESQSPKWKMENYLSHSKARASISFIHLVLGQRPCPLFLTPHFPTLRHSGFLGHFVFFPLLFSVMRVVVVVFFLAQLKSTIKFIYQKQGIQTHTPVDFSTTSFYLIDFFFDAIGAVGPVSGGGTQPKWAWPGCGKSGAKMAQTSMHVFDSSLQFALFRNAYYFILLDTKFMRLLTLPPWNNGQFPEKLICIYTYIYLYHNVIK